MYKDLVESKGNNKLIAISPANSKVGYHEGKVVHINEPGFYDLIFSSKLQDWFNSLNWENKLLKKEFLEP